MGGRAVPGSDHLEEGLGSRGLDPDLRRQDGEEEEVDAETSGEPEVTHQAELQASAAGVT